MKKFIEKIWPLPKIDQRKSIILPLRFFTKFFSLEKDSEYLCYIASILGTFLSLSFVMLLVLDLIFRFEIAFNKVIFEQNKLIFSEVFSRISSWSILLLGITFYLRIRLCLDLKNDEIPIHMHPALLLGYTQKKWIFRSIFMLFACVCFLFFSYIPVNRIAIHFNQQDSFLFILFLEVLVSLALGIINLIAISFLLTLEKVIRFFPEFEQDLLKKNPLPRNY